MPMMRLIVAVPALVLLLNACISQQLGPSAPVSMPRPAVPAPTEAGHHRVDAIGIDFPTQLGAFAYVSRQVSGSTNQGDILRYESGAVKAVVQIYDASQRSIGTGPDSVAVHQEFERARLRLLREWSSQRGAGAVRVAREETYKPPKGTSFRDVEYRGLVSARSFDIRMLLTGCKDQFIRVQLNLPTEVTESRGAEINGFIDALAELLG
jgi:hypothetical protein